MPSDAPAIGPAVEPEPVVAQVLRIKITDLEAGVVDMGRFAVWSSGEEE